MRTNILRYGIIVILCLLMVIVVMRYGFMGIIMSSCLYGLYCCIIPDEK